MLLGLLESARRSMPNICFTCRRLIKHRLLCSSLSLQWPSHQISTKAVTQAEHQVYVSVSNNIYHNLSLEEWIYDNVPISHENSLLLLWRNRPCIVIGRHQNPWTECDVAAARHKSVDIARRKSGGGTVYHDMGNLNLTFVTSRKKYNRGRNLDLIAETLRETWKLNVTVNDRDDIILDNKYKISGTAAKLGADIAYHHCTLLVNVNTEDLEVLLQTRSRGLESRATESVLSEVKNLIDVDSRISYERLVDSIAHNYLLSHHIQGVAEYIDPANEESCPGIHSDIEQHQSWQWLYGKTPKFSLSKGFRKMNSESIINLHIKLIVEKGLIKEARLSGDIDSKILEQVEEKVIDSRVWPRGTKEQNDLLELSKTSGSDELLKWVSQCLNHVL